MRALETERYILRGTNNGITALVGPDGRVQKRAPRFAEAVLSGVLHPVSGSTPFMVLGSWPTLILALVLVVMFRERRSLPAKT